jgi:hypothetical protein
VKNNIEIREKHLGKNMERTEIIAEEGGFFFMRTKISILC